MQEELKPLREEVRAKGKTVVSEEMFATQHTGNLLEERKRKTLGSVKVAKNRDIYCIGVLSRFVSFVRQLDIVPTSVRR
jgi:hypothetical protein